MGSFHNFSVGNTATPTNKYRDIRGYFDHFIVLLRVITRIRLDDIRTQLHSLTYQDRKSTRLNSSHVAISYAVFCLKKKKTTQHMYNAPTLQHDACAASR